MHRKQPTVLRRSIPYLLSFFIIFYFQHTTIFSETSSSSSGTPSIVEVYFPPEEDLRTRLITLIEKEPLEIYCAAYRLTDSAIADALEKAAERIPVTIVCDLEGFASESSCILGLFLRANAHNLTIFVFPPPSNTTKRRRVTIDTRNTRYTALMHEKVLCFRGLNIVQTGSYNYTYGARKRNLENALIIQSRRITERYLQHFSLLKKKSTLVTPKIRACLLEEEEKKKTATKKKKKKH